MRLVGTKEARHLHVGSLDSTMLAARAYAGEYRFRLENLAVPDINDDEVLIKVEAVGLTRGLVSMWYFTNRMRLFPTTLGHGIAGRVEAVGSAVHGVMLGDRVRVHALLTCGNCDYCRSDRESLCTFQCTIGGAIYGDAAMSLYARYHDGGMAQYVRVPAYALDRLPNRVSAVEGVIVGTLAGSFRALRMTEPQPGNTLVITGASGPSGASAARCAPILGFTTVCGVATNPAGLERLTRCGTLSHAIATSELPDGWERGDHLVDRIRNAVGNEGADAVVDFMPFGQDVTRQAIRSMKPGGRAVLSGGNVSDLTFSYLELMTNQYQVKGIRGHMRRDEREMLRLLGANRIRVADLVTHTLPLSEANRALDVIMGRQDSPIFVILDPWR